MPDIEFTNAVDRALRKAVEQGGYAQVIVLTDHNTGRIVLPQVAGELPPFTHITIPAGEGHKTLDTVVQVWRELQQAGATRHAVMVNLGGGMVTDLGGFAAATYKRGIPFMNVPTTLLAAVDAAVGGKTGVDFGGLKNQVGVFAQAAATIISTRFFSTLPSEELLSGYAEMVKHALLGDAAALAHQLQGDPTRVDSYTLLDALRASVMVKHRIVEQDPLEQGPRKALNLGHTVGHALESLMLGRGTPVPHGIAVAWGLVAELVLSHMAWHFPSTTLHQVAHFVHDYYPSPTITCDHYDQLLALMRHDKKSRAGEINCTLLEAVGRPKLDCTIAPDDMRTALDIFRDLMGV
ncbi:MAG: 3-dehydroquinate synthase [Muribaculaceae bacterium]|nr:3-dehydroquinate synthase [Muribaculaceae bacterium]